MSPLLPAKADASAVISRRRFLTLGAAGVAGAAIGACGRDTTVRRTRRPREPVGAIVIGSGFGGSVAALRLAEAGIETLVLERGRRWTITDAGDTFATYEAPDGRAAWLSTETVVPGQPLPGDPGVPIDVYTGVFERIRAKGIDVYAGAGVGGGSLVYNAILYQPEESLFRAAFPAIDYDEMASVHYRKVRDVIQPEPIPDDVLATDFYKGTRVLLEEGQRAGLTTRRLDLGVDWDIVRKEIVGSAKPSAIVGAAWYGINSGAKRSLDRNYLHRAEGTGRVEILPLHIVTDVGEDTHGFTVFATEIDDTGTALHEREFLTSQLFIAAGSMGTSALLVRARAKGMLPRLHQTVGTRWGANGDTAAVRFNLPSTNPGDRQGGPAGAVVEHLDNPIAPTVLENLPLPQAGFPDGSLVTLGLGLDPPRGIFRYDNTTDSAKLTWPANDREVVRARHAAKVTYDLLATRGAADPANPPVMPFFQGSFTAHPLGGVPLGLACDEFGRVHGYNGLYVVDGALIPAGNTACTNPSLTIAALAERCMTHILRDGEIPRTT